jgi:hypothetical protein
MVHQKEKEKKRKKKLLLKMSSQFIESIKIYAKSFFLPLIYDILIIKHSSKISA